MLRLVSLASRGLRAEALHWALQMWTVRASQLGTECRSAAPEAQFKTAGVGVGACAEARSLDGQSGA